MGPDSDDEGEGAKKGKGKTRGGDGKVRARQLVGHFERGWLVVVSVLERAKRNNQRTPALRLLSRNALHNHPAHPPHTTPPPLPTPPARCPP